MSSSINFIDYFLKNSYILSPYKIEFNHRWWIRWINIIQALRTAQTIYVAHHCVWQSVKNLNLLPKHIIWSFKCQWLKKRSPKPYDSSVDSLLQVCWCSHLSKATNIFWGAPLGKMDKKHRFRWKGQLALFFLSPSQYNLRVSYLLSPSLYLRVQ